MKAFPKISIVTPSFNQGKYLEKTILSVLEQGYPNLEYIIIDGGSCDESVEVIKKYADRLVYWVSEPDRGQSHAINKGFERATGEIFGWLNSDDWYHPGALQAVVEAFAANPDAGAVVGAGEMVDEAGCLVLRCEPFPVSVEAFFSWHERFFWQPSCFFTRQAWQECGPLEEQNHYAMDLALWLKIATKYPFALTGELLSFSLKHMQAKTSAAGIMATLETALVLVTHGGGVQAKQLLQHELTERDKQIVEYDRVVHSYITALTNTEQRLSQFGLELAERDRQLAERDRQLAERDRQLAESDRQLQAMRTSASWKITAPVRWLADRLARSPRALPAQGEPPHLPPYQVCEIHQPQEQRPKIVHALANFMTGGSSRLVVDLIEHLGHCYEQEVITYFCPDPPHYTNLKLHEFRGASATESISDYLREFKPDLVHVHYWGDVDSVWYEQVFAAAEQCGCRIVENVNTPVAPHVSPAIDRYVFVSDYVRNTFGKGLTGAMTIHPGSNLQMFQRQESVPVPDDCVGMVYRLEKDKLDEKAIDVFVKIAQRRPGTKLLIVGGGTFLEPYRQKVRRHGLENSFTFTGYVPYEELPALYEQMSIFVAPVWKESFGQVSPFAMSMEIPVVGYAVGALGEIIGDTTLLAPAGDSDRLADIAVGLLAKRDRRLAIGTRNRERSQRLFSVEAMVQCYDDLYRELLGGVR